MGGSLKFVPKWIKWSSLRYKIPPNPFSILNDSWSDFGEVEEVAMCWMMLSRCVRRNSNRFSFRYCGVESYRRSNIIDRNEMCR